jgi:FkbH-like protein
MYETEANHRIESSAEIPEQIVQRFGEMNGKLAGRTLIPWAEHCTECAWPTCYTTCDLYIPREDGRCRRFADGMVRVECPVAVNSYVLKIRFKRWAKLWSPANVRLYSPTEAQAKEKSDYQFGSLLRRLPLPTAAKAPATRKRYSWKKRNSSVPATSGELPTAFLCECYNPGALTVRLSLTVRPASELIQLHYQTLIEVTPGFQRVRVPMSEIMQVVNVRQPFNIELIPNDVDELTTLYFGVMDFVRETAAKPPTVSKIKCIVWDLDHTLWDGIQVEDGLEGLKLKQEIPEILRALDERGILHSIVSKNDHDTAIQALKHFGIDDYFLCPQISWGPKSEGIAAIAQQISIGKDTLLFVDDSEFERSEVKAVHPEVRTLDAREYRNIPEMKECQVTVTQESRERRKMYQVEAKRQNIAEGFGSDYLAFLRHCEMKLQIQPMTLGNLDRVHELTQRTNQMNFSGARYDREVLKCILISPDLAGYVLSCEDRFGTYGIVGFSIVDGREPRMTDLMFSCRVQSKRVEHAFLGHIIRKYIQSTGRDFFANYRKTAKNAPSGRVFQDLGMEELETVDGVTSLVFRKEKQVPDDGVVTILEDGVLLEVV